MKTISRESIIKALKTVLDPEIGIDIYTLGLIYKITIAKTKIKVLMTLTSKACPLGDQIIDDVKTSISKIKGVTEVKVELTFEPAWKASPELRLQLGLI